MSPNPLGSPNYAREVLNKVWTWSRNQGCRVVAQLVVNFALPYLIYVQAERPLGQVLAIIAASAPPMLWSVVEVARRRRLDAL
jgi:hypothetical protein